VASFVNLMQLAGTLDAEDHPFIEVEGQEVACVTAFETAGSQAALFRLLAGQRIPAHTHSAIDDIFFGVRGTAHEVSCAGDEFCYILLQAPREHYDNLPYP
jgi:hypothetical protein